MDKQDIQFLAIIIGFFVLSIGMVFFAMFYSASQANAQFEIFQGHQGGTGIGSVVAGDIGKCLQVSNNSPFEWIVATCGTGGAGTFPFTPTTNFGQNANATTVPIWLQGSPYSLFASSTSWLTNVNIGNLVATGTITVQSSNGTSTVTNALQLGSTAGDNMLRLTAGTNRDYPNSTSVGGLLNVTNTNSTGAGVVIYSNQGATASGRLLVVRADNAAFDQQAVFIQQDGAAGGYFVDCTNTTASAECANVTSTVTDQTAFGITGRPNSKGVLKVTADGGDASTAAISISLQDADVQGLFLDTIVGYTGKLANFRVNGTELFTIDSTGRTTMPGGILVNNATSTITNLTMVNATSTNATTTVLHYTGRLTGLNRVTGSTYYTLQHLFNSAVSSGAVSGGTIADIGGGAVSVAAGTGFIKATDSNVADQNFFDWAASTTISFPAATSTIYLGIEYNSGAPRVVRKTSDTWDLDTEFPLGIAMRETGTVYVANLPMKTGDAITDVIERFDGTINIQRDERQGGLIVSNSGTRNVAVTAGQLLGRLEEFAITAIDTSVSGSFDAYYRDGVGGWTKQAGATQWNNSQYDDGDGGLASIALTFYSSRWWYLMTDGSLAMLYGQSQNTALATILNEGRPSTVPDRIGKGGILIGRFIVQSGASTPDTTQSAFGTAFTAASVSDHGSLAGLSDDDHTIYALLAGRVLGQTLQGGTGAGETLSLQGTSHATAGSILLNTGGGNVGVGTSTPAMRFSVHDNALISGNLSIAGLFATGTLSTTATTSIATTSTTARVNVGGTISQPVKTVTANYTPNSNDYWINVNTAAGNITINLPVALGFLGSKFCVRKDTSDTNTVIIDPSGTETISGQTTRTIRQQNTTWCFISTGTSWNI